MEMAHNVSIPELTEAISAQLVAQWEAWKNQDAASNNAIIADDFNSFWPDGSRHIGKPTAQQMSEQPITGYKLSQLRVVPVGADVALVTYFADVKTPGEVLPSSIVGEAIVTDLCARMEPRNLHFSYQQVPKQSHLIYLASVYPKEYKYSRGDCLLLRSRDRDSLHLREDSQRTRLGCFGKNRQKEAGYDPFCRPPGRFEITAW